MAADGSRQVRLTHDGNARNTTLAWSDEGRELYYQHFCGPSNPCRDPTSIRAVELDGWVVLGEREERRSPYAFSRARSPDGTRAAVAVLDTVQKARAICLVDVATEAAGPPVRLTRAQVRRNETSPSWSPDGRRIAFSAGPGFLEI